MLLKTNRGEVIAFPMFKNKNYCYRKFISDRYYRHFRCAHAEKKAWCNYIFELKDNSLPLNSMRRSKPPNDWDIEKYSSAKLEHPRSWKCHYKCKKQWMKNL